MLQAGASDEYPQHMLFWKGKKIFLGYPILIWSYVMTGEMNKCS